MPAFAVCRLKSAQGNKTIAALTSLNCPRRVLLTGMCIAQHGHIAVHTCMHLAALFWPGLANMIAHTRSTPKSQFPLRLPPCAGTPMQNNLVRLALSWVPGNMGGRGCGCMHADVVAGQKSGPARMLFMRPSPACNTAAPPAPPRQAEFFAMSSFVCPDVLGSLATFERVFSAPIAKSRDRNASAEEKALGEMRSA